MTEANPILVLCTCPNQAVAEEISQQLLQKRLAACINSIAGVTSSYRWQGKIETEAEVLMIIKSTSEQYPVLQNEIAQLHPYELPEILAVTIDTGLPSYLNWIVENTTES